MPMFSVTMTTLLGGRGRKWREKLFIGFSREGHWLGNEKPDFHPPPPPHERRGCPSAPPSGARSSPAPAAAEPVAVARQAGDQRDHPPDCFGRGVLKPALEWFVDISRFRILAYSPDHLFLSCMF